MSAKLKSNDLQAKTDTELNQLLLELRKEQFSLKMSKGSGEDVKSHQFMHVRRNIARVKTFLNSEKLS